MRYVTSPLLSKNRNYKLIHLFSTINYTRFDLANEYSDHHIIETNQVHDNTILDLEEIKSLKFKTPNNSTMINSNADGLMGSRLLLKNRLLLIRTADCVPIIVYGNFCIDETNERDIAAVIHAGWRSIAKNIIENMVEKLLKNNILVDQIYISMGPHICICCFAVGEEVINKFKELLKNKGMKNEIDEFLVVKKNSYQTYFNLAKFITVQCISMGILRSNIWNSNLCTYCQNFFFSYRKTNTNQRLFSLIGF